MEDLLKNPNFVRFWGIKFGDMLQISTTRFGNGFGAYQYWLTDRLIKNEPWDAMVRELLTSLGNPFDLREGARSTTPSTAPILNPKPNSPRNASSAFESAVRNATIIRSTSGPKTTITASPPSSPRSIAAADRTR